MVYTLQHDATAQGRLQKVMDALPCSVVNIASCGLFLFLKKSVHISSVVGVCCYAGHINRELLAIARVKSF